MMIEKRFNKHIVLCINSKWLMQVCVLIKSILTLNNEDFTFHIIGKDISDNIINKIQIYAKTCPVIYHNINNVEQKNFILRKGDHVTMETYFRFYIPDFLDERIKKCLYLDSDILCTGNFEKLFDLDLTNYSMGMVYDIGYSDIRKFNRLQYDVKYGYYNAGVILINLDYWRKNNIQKQLIDFVLTYPERCFLHDQDAINYICHGTIFPIHVSYNVERVFWRVYSWKNPKNYPKYLLMSSHIARDKWDEIIEACEKPILVHFTDKQKPWIIDTFVPFTKAWRYFCSQTEFKWKKNLKKRLRVIKRKLLKQRLDNEYPPEAYESENRFIKNLLMNN